MQRCRYGVWILILAIGGGYACGEDGDNDSNVDGQSLESLCTGPFGPEVDELPLDVAPPIVFVHGFAGSAQQFQSQAMRFDANGYPHERIFAFDHVGDPSAVQSEVIAGVDAMVDGALAQFSVEQVILVGHSRGTSMSNAYLGDAGRAAKVAKYISLDGQGCAAAETAGVECLNLNQAILVGQRHVEVATSREAFEGMFEFVTGRAHTVSDVVSKEDAPVLISGRAVDFPQNSGKDGAVLKIFEIDPETGHRLSDKPLHTVEIGADGNFGPIEIGCGRYYEKELALPGTDAFQHFYFQPYLRSTHFVRLLSAPPDAETVENTNVGDGHAAVIAMRMREWCSDDVLEISTTSPSGNQDPIDVMTDEVGECGNGFISGSIGVHIHDGTASPGESSLDVLPWFGTQPFQTGVDVYMPASDPPDGTITVRNIPRGFPDKPQVIRAANWSSSLHRIMVMFNDYAQ